MNSTDISKAQGHWVLAQMGKKVLRPGGKELTRKMTDALQISENDDIVEFAPGLGYTASLTLKNNPRSYIGIEVNEDAIKQLQKIIFGKNRSIINANAAQTTLPDCSVTKVYGEAMLTMHADHRKTEIIRESHRILKKGGLYAIHELGLMPNSISDNIKNQVQKELSLCIRVNARPLTQTEWIDLIRNEGFEIKTIETNPMHLLELGRILDDEGFLRTIKIGYNIITNSLARARILEMRKVFRRHARYMNAIVIVAEKK